MKSRILPSQPNKVKQFFVGLSYNFKWKICIYAMMSHEKLDGQNNSNYCGAGFSKTSITLWNEDLHFFNSTFLLNPRLDKNWPTSFENMRFSSAITSGFIPFPHSLKSSRLTLLMEKFHSSTKWKSPSPYYTGLNLIHLNMNPVSKANSHHMFFLGWNGSSRPEKYPTQLT